MNSKYQGPAIFPPAAEVKKRVEAHLDALTEPHQKQGRSTGAPKRGQTKLRKRPRRP